MRFYHSIRVLLVLLALGCCFSAKAASAESSTGKRWLIVLETSSSMQRRKDGALQVLDSLLASKMAGQLAPGDTIGVWTFNSQVHTGELPLQRWSPEAAERVRNVIVDFARQRAYERAPDVTQVIPAVSQLISNSPIMTVVIVSSGEGEVLGTPFDRAINEAWATWRPEQQKTRMPILTVLRGVRGRMVSQSVSPAQYPLELPPLPQEPVRQKKPQTNVAEAKKTATVPDKPTVIPKAEAPKTQVPPLIISGKKQKPEPAAPTNPPAQFAATNVDRLAMAAPISSEPTATNGARPSVTNAASTPPTASRAGEPTTNLTAPAVRFSQQKTPTQSLASIPEPLASAPIQTAAAVPLGKAQGEPGKRFIWMLAFGVAVPLLLLVIWVLVRASRRKPVGSSLITESLDAEKREGSDQAPM